MAAVEPGFHATAPSLAVQLAAFLALPHDDQRRHLHPAHHVTDTEADLVLLARTEGRAVTDGDAHEWWHLRQRRSMTIGGARNDQGVSDGGEG